MNRMRWRLAGVTLLILACSGAFAPGSAQAAERHISQIKTVDAGIEVLFTANTSGARLDPSGVRVEIDGRSVEATAKDVSGAARKTEQSTVVLLVDTSGSMKGAGIDAAKKAATAFLSSVPADVRVGLVGFSSAPGPVLSPTLNRAQIRAAVGKLTAQGETALYDGLAAALRQVGTVGLRRVVLLSDGADTTSKTSLAAVVTALRNSGAALDAVGFQTTEKDIPALALLTKVGGGKVVSAQDAAGLSAAFRKAAAGYNGRLLVVVPVPKSFAGKDVTLKVTAVAGKQAFSDEARTKLPGRLASAPVPLGKVPAVPKLLLFIGLGGLFLGLLLLALLLAQMTSGKQRDKSRMTKIVAQYTNYPRVEAPKSPTALGENQIARTAVEWAGHVVQRRGIDQRLALKLDRAGISLRPAEWFLIQFSVPILAALLISLLLSNVVLGVLLGGVLGVAGPLLFLSLKASRRQKAFQDQLPDSLQLIASGLSSGYSFVQALDSVVREGAPPISTEIGRALAQARLGVQIEDALEAVADRMDSVDFRWTVMAVRVQSDVGGNLSEVLTIVAKTMRDRAQLRRHVRALAAEGRLSGYVLVGLPIAIALFTFTFRREYMKPLYTDPIGIAMSITAVILVLFGALWMKKLVKVEV